MADIWCPSTATLSKQSNGSNNKSSRIIIIKLIKMSDDNNILTTSKIISFLYPRPTKIHRILDSPCPSVCPSVCRRRGFRSISQVCFGISISNFICMLMVAIGRSLLIFSDVTFKMAAWRPYWIFWFPDSNFTLSLNINFKLQQHNTYVYG